MSIDESWPTLGMERDEVERYRLAVCRALVVLAMLQKVIQKGGGFSVCGSGARRSANNCVGQCSADSRHRIVIELEVLGRGSVPVHNVWLVPHLEVPGAQLLPPVALNKVLSVLARQLAPHLVVLGRIVDLSSHGGLGIVKLIFGDCGDRRCKILRHKAKFTEH